MQSLVKRPSKHETFLEVARVLSMQSTCTRRQVGCVLVDKYGHIIGTGYNGTAAGLPHCIDIPCKGSGMVSGSGLVECEAIHAEQNALMQCKDIKSIVSVYTTTSPCMHCLKMLLNTSCQNIYFNYQYTGWEECKRMWLAAGRQWACNKDFL